MSDVRRASQRGLDALDWWLIGLGAVTLVAVVVAIFNAGNNVTLARWMWAVAAVGGATFFILGFVSLNHSERATHADFKDFKHLMQAHIAASEATRASMAEVAAIWRKNGDTWQHRADDLGRLASLQISELTIPPLNRA